MVRAGYQRIAFFLHLFLICEVEGGAHTTCSRGLDDIQDIELNDTQTTVFLQTDTKVNASTPQASLVNARGAEQSDPEAAAGRASTSKPVTVSLAEVHSSQAPAWAWIYVAACFSIGPVCMVLASAFVSTGTKPTEKRGRGDPIPTRVAYLDLWRIMCVAVMITSHAGEDFDAYVEYNMLGGQQWVLPCIMLISGTCYFKSSLPTAHYISRLLAYFSFGNVLNWVAAEITGTRWWIDITIRGITFQMFFVLGLGASVLVTAPLRARLKSHYDQPSGLSVQSCFYGSVCCGLLFLYWYGNITWSSLELQLIRVVGESACTLLLAMLALDFVRLQQQDLTGWVLLVWIYATRCLRAEPRPGHEIHLHDLLVFAVFVQQIPLRGSKTIGALLAQAWPILLLLGGFMLHPGLKQRLDLEPPSGLVARVRHYTLEALCVVAFTTIPTAGPERTIPLPDCIRRNISWANHWALFAYCSHYAIYRLLLGDTWQGGESTTGGVCIMFGLSLIFYALAHCRSFYAVGYVPRSDDTSPPEVSVAKLMA